MRKTWMTDGSVRLFAVEDGDGPALVFLHGGLANHQAVLPLVGSLANRYRVVTPDLRGSGRSWSSESLTFDRLSVEMTRALLSGWGAEPAALAAAERVLAQVTRERPLIEIVENSLETSDPPRNATQ